MVTYYTKDDYSKAYVEVLEIFKYISKEDFNKIPIEFIEFLKENMDLNYNYKYNINKGLDEQPISKLTKLIIANIYLKYWATENQKIDYKKRKLEYYKETEREKREKYNPENLFKKEKRPQEKQNTAMIIIEEDENILKKILKKIKSIIKKLT